MSGTEQSDSLIVPRKSANKAARAAAEPMGERFRLWLGAGSVHAVPSLLVLPLARGAVKKQRIVQIMEMGVEPIRNLIRGRRNASSCRASSMTVWAGQYQPSGNLPRQFHAPSSRRRGAFPTTDALSKMSAQDRWGHGPATDHGCGTGRPAG